MALVLERHRVEHHEWLVFDEEQPIAISKLHFEASADGYERNDEGITLQRCQLTRPPAVWRATWWHIPNAARRHSVVEPDVVIAHHDLELEVGRVVAKEVSEPRNVVFPLSKRGPLMFRRMYARNTGYDQHRAVAVS
jgi:hypothetical protein